MREGLVNLPAIPPHTKMTKKFRMKLSSYGVPTGFEPATLSLGKHKGRLK